MSIYTTSRAVCPNRISMNIGDYSPRHVLFDSDLAALTTLANQAGEGAVAAADLGIG